MKKKFLYLTATIILSLSITTYAQNQSGAFDGLQNSLNQFVDAASETYQNLQQNYDELLRISWLMGTDVRMRMNAKFDPTSYGNMYLGIMTWTTEHTGSLYAEFDWQNMSESIRARSSESEVGAAVAFLGTKTRKNEAQDFMMYVDALGFWYVPTEIEGNEVYVRVHLMNSIQNVAAGLEIAIEAAIEANVAQMLDQLAILAITAQGDWMSGLIPPEVALAYYASDGNVAEGVLEQALEELALLQYEQISSLPPLIHFAFVISPTLARTQFNVQESTVTWDGQENCTKMTVVGGSDNGYVVVFDKYGRLIHLRDTDDGTADYWYDRDVTVNIPPAVSINMGNIISNE